MTEKIQVPLLDLKPQYRALKAEIDAANAARLAWMSTAQVVLNAAEIKEATDACEKWTNDNTQLYGLLVQAMPAWLVTSLYNTHLNDGVAAIE
jgi:hypothetical protein